MTSVLTISTEGSFFNEVREILNFNSYKVFQADIENFILNIYQHNVKFILVDLDNASNTILNSLKDYREIEYIPIIGLYSDHNEVISSNISFIKTVIAKNNMNSSLIHILDSLLELKIQYDTIKESNDAIDMMTNEISKLFKTNSYSIKSLLQNIFSSNTFLQNKPSMVIIMHADNNNLMDVQIYRNINGTTIHDTYLNCNKSSTLHKSFSVDTEFYSNCMLNEFSDMDNYKYIIKNIINCNIEDIINYAGYVSSKMAVIAINYEQTVSKLDAKIIKSLCTNLNLVRNIYDKVDEVNEAFVYTIEALARAGEAADDDTGSHIKRVNEYSKFLSEKLGMNSSFCEKIYFSAQMHDVGKIHIPHSILKKNGPLTQEEYETMKLHTVYGPKIIGTSPHLKMASDIALNHHEKYDGTGYPNKIKGDEIPISARIVSLADIYDALRNSRVYKPPFSHEKAVEIITIGDGRVMPQHFDPEVLNIFMKFNEEFNQIWNTFNLDRME